jgi:FkbH-like protein
MSKVSRSSLLTQHEQAAKEEWRRERKIKCLVWDLDNTLWDGILLEDSDVSLREGVVEVLRTLDERGILHSVASRNDYEMAMSKLEYFGIDEYFVYPQINWGAKSGSIEQVARSINIGMDTIALIDDQAFERDEVMSVHPEVQCFVAADLISIPDRPAMTPRFVSDESRQRRSMLQADMVRKQAEESFAGAQDQFLASLDMRLEIFPAGESDLKRAEELTLRTNQLNTTGRTYSYDELDELRLSENFHLWVARLDDKYGSHGTIGLALIEKLEREWWIRLLLMSCRVMNRGIGGVIITYIRNRAREAGVRLLSDMIINDRNRMMYMTYKFNHFRETDQSGDMTIFESDLSQIQPFPDYLRVKARS